MKNAPQLGVCYYPEHWPESKWAEDASNMAALGLTRVRIGEFAWSRIEPDPRRFDWGWLDRAIATLGAAGLKVVLGTPTATPPKWLIDMHPDILAVDRFGRPRKFGSRRHYCFSSERYRAEAARIVEAVAARYGRHDAVVAWQTDNEYGCHDTVRSYSAAAAKAFRLWLKQRYSDIGALNAAWGNVFWSQEYRAFDEIDLPNLTVTEPNPSAVLDFHRFASDEVVAFNRLQADILRRLSPGRDILHNFMGFFADFDHFAVAADLDAVGWDSYPIGFLDVGPFTDADKARYLRQGHPDVAAFHHDLYRACGRGRWQVLEQQPGPVNWAPHNPAPLPGMARLWTLEAVAHGAEAVSFFRWRQAPFAQEQMHAGLQRPDGAPAPAFEEVRQAAEDIKRIGAPPARRGDVALIFSYDAQWLFEAQPQGRSWRYLAIAFEWYSVLRRLGLDVDILPDGAPLDGYALALVPSLPILKPDFIEGLRRSKMLCLFGPRTGSKTVSLTIPENLAPGPLQTLLPIKVALSESLPPGKTLIGEFNGRSVSAGRWLDRIETRLIPLAGGAEGGFLFRQANALYLTTLPDPEFLGAIIATLAAETGLETTLLPPDLRRRRLQSLEFFFNYGPDEIPLPLMGNGEPGKFLIGGPRLKPADVAVRMAG